MVTHGYWVIVVDSEFFDIDILITNYHIKTNSIMLEWQLREHT